MNKTKFFVCFIDTTKLECDCLNPPICEITFNKAERLLRSPRYPFSYCPDETGGYAFFYTDPNVAGKGWKLHFNEFTLAPGSEVGIYGGSKANKVLLKTFYPSDAVTSDFVFKSNYVLIRFVAGADTDTGFEIKVTSQGTKNMHDNYFTGLHEMKHSHHINIIKSNSKSLFH